jgi:uncharacterized protein with HEPN domain
MRDNRHDSFTRLLHISKAIDDIRKYVADESVASFIENNKTHDAVLFQFTIIGEAINFVSPDILEKYGYPWYKVRSFRNMISHEYFNIKMDAVWQIIQTGLPELQLVIQNILNNEF